MTGRLSGSCFWRRVRNSRSDYLNRPDIDVAEVAYLLGYEDSNSFYRAFRTWEGTTPAQLRSALRRSDKAEGHINAEEDPDLLAALFINCWQGAIIRLKCDPEAPCDCLRFALDRVLGNLG